MEILFERHDTYLANVPMEYIRGIMQHIDWNARLLVIKGPKGVGKSTLIKSILGQLPAKGGTAKFSPSSHISYFSQELEWDNNRMTPMQIISDKFPKLNQRAIRTKLAKCGLDAANAIKPIGELSGGEQTKVKLAMMEFTPTNFLIMDEPTNHLDEETKEALKRALDRFPGNLIIVSHESSFYDGLVDKVLNVEQLSLKEKPVIREES